jgi:hypothetical protein
LNAFGHAYAATGLKQPTRSFHVSSAATADVTVVGADAPAVDAEGALSALTTRAAAAAVWRTVSLAEGPQRVMPCSVDCGNEPQDLQSA